MRRHDSSAFARFSRGAAAVIAGFLLSCTAVPAGVQPVTGFEPARYLGKWYEIARLDHRFERGLSNVTAEYSRPEGGDVVVVNRGYDAVKKTWKESRGRARFTGEETVGRLKVSFFGPFWGAYNVIALDREGYRYAMVCGPNQSYLWILSREPRLDPQVQDQLLARARAAGFETEKLIFVAHDLQK